MRMSKRDYIRLTAEEYNLITDLASARGCPRSQIWRNLLKSVWVLYDEDLMLGDLLDLEKAGHLRPEVERLVKLIDEKGLSLSQMTRPVDEVWRRLEERKLQIAIAEYKKRNK